MNKEINVTVIGLGGIGSYLCDPLFRYLNFKEDINIKANLIDGDQYESKNLARQNFVNVDSFKSRDKKVELERKFPFVKFENITEYINSDNISNYIGENDYVFICVDNHKTRKIINDYVKQLSDIVVISGGNDYSDGNVQIYIRKNGMDILPSLTDYHPEILNHEDQTPEEMSCEELHNSEPQLIFANLFASTLMVSSFFNIFENSSINNISEIYFDVIQLAASPKIRKVK